MSPPTIETAAYLQRKVTQGGRKGFPSQRRLEAVRDCLHRAVEDWINNLEEFHRVTRLLPCPSQEEHKCVVDPTVMVTEAEADYNLVESNSLFTGEGRGGEFHTMDRLTK